MFSTDTDTLLRDTEVFNSIPHPLTTKSSEITTELVNNETDLDLLEDEWEELTEKSNAGIYQTFDWQRIWWRHFGGGYRMHIIVFRSGGRLVGVAPLFIERTSLFFNVSYLRLRLIGSTIPSGGVLGTFANYSPTDYLDVIVDPDYENEIAELFLLYLEKSGDQLNQIDFDEVREDSFLMRKILPELKERNWSYKKIQQESCPQIVLPEKLEEYLFELSSNSRYQFRYSKRAVTEKNLYRIEDVESESRMREIFKEFVVLHQKRWNRAGMPGVFADARFRVFLEDVSETLFRKRRLLIKTAWVDQQCLAVNFFFRYNNRVYDYQKAYDDESSLSRYRPGKALLFDMITEAIDNGNSVIDLLRGDEKYKSRISNDVNHNWKIVIPDRDLKKGVKYRCFGAREKLNDLHTRLGRERLLLKIHLKEHGASKFLPRYYKFLNERIKGR